MRAVDQIMQKGGVVHDYHTNRVVGKLFKVSGPFPHPDYPDKMAISGKGIIFQNLGESCDIAWDKLKSGEYAGISFGGRLESTGKTEGYEFALCKVSANPPNRITAVSVAQAGKTSWVKQAGIEIQQPFADYKDFADCVSKNQDKDNPEAYCGHIKAKTEQSDKNAAVKAGGEGGLMETKETPPAKAEAVKQGVAPQTKSGELEIKTEDADPVKEKPSTGEVATEEKKEAKRAAAQAEPEAPAPAPTGDDRLARIEEMLTRLLNLLQPASPAQAEEKKEDKEEKKDDEKEKKEQTTAPDDESAKVAQAVAAQLPKLIQQAIKAAPSGGTAPRPPTVQDETAGRPERMSLQDIENTSWMGLMKLSKASRGG